MRTGLLVGPSSTALGNAIADRLDLEPVHAIVRHFPDGECCVSCPIGERYSRLIIVQGTHSPQDLHLQQLYQMIDVAAARGCADIVCVVPYLAYSRQDRRFSADQPHSALIVARTLRALGARTLVTVDAHNPEAFRLEGLRFVNLSAADLLIAHLATGGEEELVVVSPDRGGATRAGRVAARLGLGMAVYDKVKDAEGHTSYPPGEHGFHGARAVVVDDLCSSGSTLLPLTRRLLGDGARKVSICVTHMLADSAALGDRLGPDCSLIFTDSIPSGDAKVALCGLFASHLIDHIASDGARRPDTMETTS